jgi:hypothetical protein
MDTTQVAQQDERLLARQLARQLTKQELRLISGGAPNAGGRWAANSCSVNSSTVCCDCDSGGDD